MLKPSLRAAVSLAVTGSDAEFSVALVAGETYRITGDVAFWYKLAATGVGGAATAGGAGCIYVAPGCDVYDTPVDDLVLHILRASISGTVNVARVVGTL